MLRIGVSLLCLVAAGCAEERVSNSDAMLLIDLEQRMTSASAVAVVTIGNATSRWDSNAWGDKLITTRADAAIEEPLRGRLPETVHLETVGGTVGDVTLVASHHPRLRRGRAVVFLGAQTGEAFEMPLGERAVLELDETDHVRGYGVGLDELRALARDR